MQLWGQINFEKKSHEIKILDHFKQTENIKSASQLNGNLPSNRYPQINEIV